ncbi:MAG: hypothetical protein ABI947_27510 [Chloroflexota bacterium]
MYSRRANKLPGCLAVAAALLLVFGGYTIWRGFMGFMASSGNIIDPVIRVTTQNNINQTATVDAKFGTLDLSNPSGPGMTPTKSCQTFKVKVVKARIRECPKDTCNTITFPAQGASICVYGIAPDATDWYQVNVDPTDPITQLGYMHESVIVPGNPTARPLNLPTVTPVPSNTPTQTPKPLPTPTINPAVPPTWTPSSPLTRTPSVDSA